MTTGFLELLAFTAALIVFALAIIIPFIIYLLKKSKQDQQQSESCHAFQRELNRQTSAAFSDVAQAMNTMTQAMNANTKTITDFLNRESLKGSVRT